MSRARAKGGEDEWQRALGRTNSSTTCIIPPIAPSESAPVGPGRSEERRDSTLPAVAEEGQQVGRSAFDVGHQVLGSHPATAVHLRAIYGIAAGHGRDRKAMGW